MFDLITYRKFRDTPQVRFFDITIQNSNARDLVFHDGPAVSPNNDTDDFWQFYMHSHQEDNLMALSGGRTFYLVNFQWAHPYHMVRVETGGEILRIPPGTFHRSISDPGGSLVINQAVRDSATTIEREFQVYNSARISRLHWTTSHIMPEMHGFSGPICRAA